MAETSVATAAAPDSAAPIVPATEAPTKPETVEVVPPWKQKLQEHVKAREAKLRPVEKPVIPAGALIEPGKAVLVEGLSREEPLVPKATPPAADDDLSVRLSELARQARSLAQREKDLREREKSTLATHQADIDLATKLRAASSTGKRLDLLRAAGVAEQDIKGTWVLDLLQELKESDEGAGPGLTEQQARALFEQQQREQQAQQIRARKEAEAAQLESRRATYFSGVSAELKAGEYPLVRAIRPTLHELDVELTDHHAKTGVALTPAELLARFEARYKAAGVTMTVAEPAPPAVPARPAARTITRDQLSDVGGRAPDEAPEETYREKTERLKAEMRKRFPKRT